MTGMQPAYGTAPPRRPPLPPAMARSARIAGGVGFVAMSLGWSVFLAASVLGVVLLALSAVFSAVAAQDARFAEQLAELLRRLGTAPVGLVVGGVVVVLLIGAAIWTAGLLISRGVLARSGHPHPWGVTWAGLGIGIVASWIATAIAQVVASVAGALMPLPQRLGDPAGVGAGITVSLGEGIAGVVVIVALHVAAGVLVWWWMAWAMRPAAV